MCIDAMLISSEAGASGRQEIHSLEASWQCSKSNRKRWWRYLSSLYGLITYSLEVEVMSGVQYTYGDCIVPEQLHNRKGIASTQCSLVVQYGNQKGTVCDTDHWKTHPKLIANYFDISHPSKNTAPRPGEEIYKCALKHCGGKVEGAKLVSRTLTVSSKKYPGEPLAVFWSLSSTSSNGLIATPPTTRLGRCSSLSRMLRLLRPPSRRNPHRKSLKRREPHLKLTMATTQILPPRRNWRRLCNLRRAVRQGKTRIFTRLRNRLFPCVIELGWNLLWILDVEHYDCPLTIPLPIITTLFYSEANIIPILFDCAVIQYLFRCNLINKLGFEDGTFHLLALLHSNCSNMLGLAKEQVAISSLSSDWKC